MSNAEIGMLLVMFSCVAITVLTVVTAGKRIEQEKKSKCEYRDLYHKTYNRLTPQKALNVYLEKELADAKQTAANYEKMLLDTEDEAIDTADYYEEETEKNITEIPITEIATELCKRSDVVHFMIDVKNDTQKYSLSGGR